MENSKNYQKTQKKRKRSLSTVSSWVNALELLLLNSKQQSQSFHSTQSFSSPHPPKDRWYLCAIFHRSNLMRIELFIRHFEFLSDWWVWWMNFRFSCCGSSVFHFADKRFEKNKPDFSTNRFSYVNSYLWHAFIVPRIRFSVDSVQISI